MTEREVTPCLPTSGQIIGAVVSKLGIKHPKLRSKTARRYFAADTEQLVKDTSRDDIIGAVAEALVVTGFSATRQQRETDKSALPRLDAVLKWNATNWDQLRTFIRPRMARVLPGHLSSVWEAYVRLAVIDLAIRVAAHLHLAGSSTAALALLDSASVRARGAYLNQKRQQAGISLEGLAESVGATNNAVDAWMYHGTRPSDYNIIKIGEALSGEGGLSGATNMVRELRALYWISDITDLLADHIRTEALDEAIGRLRRYAEATYHMIAEQIPDEGRLENLTNLADLGVNARRAQPLLAALIEQESDDEWREDLRATGINWVRRVLSVNQRVHFAEEDDLIQKTEGRLLEDWDVSNPVAYAHYRRSLELQVQGKLDEALAEVIKAAQLDPLDPANHFTIGSVKGGLGADRGDMTMVNEGIEACWLAVALDPNWILPWTEVGLILLRVGRAAEAIEHLQGVKPDCGPLDSRYYSTLGTAYWHLGQLPEALAAFEGALELDPEDPSDLLAASEIALEIGDNAQHRRYARMARHFGTPEETEKFLELLRGFRQRVPTPDAAAEHDRNIAVMDAVIKLSPDDDYAHMRRGLAHFAKGDDDAAMADLDAILGSDPDHAAAYLLRGILFGNRKQWDRIIADMSELIRLKPDNAMAYYHRGQAYGEQDMLDHALADLSEAIRLAPDHADSYRGRGDCLRYKSEYDKAVADFDTALRLDPENAAAYLGRGAAYRMKGDPDRAIADYDATLRLKPKDPFAYRFRGDAYLAKEEYDLAIADCNSALNLNSGDAMVYFTRGNGHLFKGQLELALADFSTAIEYDPTSADAIYGRGLVRELMGDADGAAKDYQQARELGYE